MQNLLEIDSVIKTLGGRQILTDIHLECITGDIIGLIGRNGTGKSTLLKILFGTLAADRKFIRINGKIHDQPYKIINELCYLPQDTFLLKHLTVGKIVELYLGKKQVESFLDDSILSDFKFNKVFNLSGGELRYLEIKLLLCLDCKFVLLDEPFNGVSPILIESIKKLLLDNATSKGIILTDHDYRNVIQVANKLCLIVDGGTKVIKDKDELVTWGYISDSKL